MKKIISLLFLCLFCLCFFQPVQGFQTKEWYVSPTGNDSGDGTITSPFRTLEHAVSHMNYGDTLYLREGTYHEVLVPKSNTHIKAYPGETPIVTACDPLTNWNSLGNNLYEATMDWSLQNKNMILVDDEFAYEARWPDNQGTLLYPTMSKVTAINSNDRTVFQDSALPDDLDLTGASVWICGGSQWIFWTKTITNYDSHSKTITMASPFQNAPNSAYDPKMGNPYVVMGKREFLSCQNEWFYDNQNKKLILWSKESPSSLKVEAKKREHVLDLSGVTNTQIHDIHFTGGTIKTDNNTSYNVLSEIKSTYAAHSFYTSVTGHQIKGHHNLIENSEFAYASFTILQDSGSYNRYINNYIHDMNYHANFKGSINLSGIKTVFSHNTVCNGGRELLTLHDGQASLIQYNDLYHSSTLTWDTAAIYVNMTDGDNTVIRYNTVHDTVSTILGMGIYFDPCVQNFIVYGNVIWNMTNSAIRTNNPANYILLYNNSSYNTGSLTTGCSGNRIDGDLYGTRYVNNIFDNAALSRFPNNTVFQYNILKSTTFYPALWDYKMEEKPMLGTQTGSADYKNPEKNDFRLKDDSPLLQAGTPLPGISEGNYIGAYAPNSKPLDTGHDFSKHYNEQYEFPNVIHMNRIRNAAFGYGDLRYWNKEGSNVSINKASSWNNTNTTTRAGEFSVKLGAKNAEKNTISQKIKGLSKNTTYTLSGWGLTDGVSTLTMGIRELKLSTRFTKEVWDRKYITFNTGNLTEVTVYYECPENGPVYGGDMGLSQPTLMSETTFKEIKKETLAEDIEPLLHSDKARYGILTVETVTFGNNTAEVSLLNHSEKEIVSELQVLSYRKKGNAKEFLGIDRYPVAVSPGSLSEPSKQVFPLPLPMNKSTGEYQITIRLTDDALLIPLSKTFKTQYQIP